jgi:hypothetical protein
MATLNVRVDSPRVGTLSGCEFDDAANLALLHVYFRLNTYTSHDFGKRLQIFSAGENLFNRQIEVAKTPTTTLATGRVARVGFQIWLGSAR